MLKNKTELNKGNDVLQDQVTSEKGVSDVGIEVRRGDTRNKGILSHGYGRTTTPEIHKERAKDYFRHILKKIKSMPKPNLPDVNKTEEAISVSKIIEMAQELLKSVKDNPELLEKLKKSDSWTFDKTKKSFLHPVHGNINFKQGTEGIEVKHNGSFLVGKFKNTKDALLHTKNYMQSLDRKDSPIILKTGQKFTDKQTVNTLNPKK